ncbi:polysaccharide pyruvyl transferase CsaB [Dapis sp. BLCC M172]|uniref:polysaccharide pyruvyl transferase CsaB n=1 Tax=Dapis sp. BLCC M172 TaxID=2975281 RepID=UPI003CFA12D3
MRAILCGYYGKGNGGDEALLASLLQMLPDNIQPYVLSGNPSETEKRYGVEAGDRLNTFTILQAMRRSDIFIWGGGSLIQDATSIASPFYYAGLMGIAQKMGLKTIAWAQGIGPLNYQTTQFLARQCFKGCTAVSVRDGRSAEIVAKWNIPFTLAPDPVWALETSPVPGLWDLPAPRVAVSLRPHPQLTPSRLATLTQALISFQKATEAFILLLPFQPIKDLEIAEFIHQKFPDHSKILTVEDPRVLKGVFRGVEMVIGMRFHSLIMGFTQECRCFAISYDPKVSQLMTDLEMPGWELSELPEDANLISKIWINNYANGEALLSDKIYFFRERALIHQEVLHSFLEGIVD